MEKHWVLRLFLVAQALAFFAAGAYAGQRPAFADTVTDALKSLRVLLEMYAPSLSPPPVDEEVIDDDLCQSWGAIDRGQMREAMHSLTIHGPLCRTNHHRAQMAAARLEFPVGGGLADPVLFQGGKGLFRDLCPDAGCLAVVYAGAGDVVRAYPWRGDEIEAASIVDAAAYPYERPLGWSFADNAYPSGMDIYPDGDLLVVFNARNSFPTGLGVARIAPDGQPRWYRPDFSHHWPVIDEGGIALVPGLRKGQRETSLEFTVGWQIHDMECPLTDMLDDYVTFIDGQGRLLRAISVLDALADSPYSSFLKRVAHSCDPTHLNFVHRLGPDAGGAPDMQPGDIVISLRRLDAFVLLDRDDYRVKRFVRGSFRSQHSVRHLTRAQFLLFDNWGTDGRHGPSRVMQVDLATGQEITVFPTDATPDSVRSMYTEIRGHIDISPDRRRLLISRAANRGLEIRLADGQILTVFHSLHDVSQHPKFPATAISEAWRFRVETLVYAPAAD